MSEGQPGKTTRRGLLGTAAVVAALPLAAQGGSASPLGEDSISLAQATPPAQPPALAQAAATPPPGDWTKPAAMAIPKEGYFQLQQGRYGPIFPKTPANYGFTIIAKIKPGTEENIRNYGKTLERTVAQNPDILAPLQLHYLRWVLFPIGNDMYFMYQGIFDTDFDRYTEDAVALFRKAGVHTAFENLEGFPDDWQTNAPAFIKYVRDHQYPSFLEYGEYPYVSGVEVKNALRLKSAVFGLLEQSTSGQATAPAAPASAQPQPGDWTRPAAMAIPKEGYFQLHQGRYGPIFPKTPANYGFTIIAKIKPGTEENIRAHGKAIERAVAQDPNILAPLQLHFLRWQLVPIGNDTYFIYQGIFDTDFDRYTEDAVALFQKAGVHTTFVNLEGFPEDWQTNAPAFVKFVREHQHPSFLEYGEYPYVSGVEVKKALRLKAALFGLLEQAQ
jgi:hypothetical protein